MTQPIYYIIQRPRIPRGHSIGTEPATERIAGFALPTQPRRGHPKNLKFGAVPEVFRSSFQSDPKGTTKLYELLEIQLHSLVSTSLHSN